MKRKWELMELRKEIGRKKKSTNDHKMKIKLEGTDGKIGTMKNTERNREDKTTKLKTKF